MDNEPHLIRRGNHFLKLGDLGWVLIDGPWFECLSAWEDPRIIMPRWHGGVVEWGVVYYNPGNFVTRTHFKSMPIHLLWKYEKWSKSRDRIGYRVLPGGLLPCFLNEPEYDEQLGRLDFEPGLI